MSLLYRQNNQKNNSQKNIVGLQGRQSLISKQDYRQDTILKTRLKQKKQIKIYIKDGKYFIEHSAAYALGLINTRAIMLDKPKLVEIPIEVHNKIKNNDEFEIEYIKVEKKEKLMVFVGNSSYFITNSAAYSLKFLSDEEFLSSKEDYFYITENVLNSLKEKYDIEFYSLNLYKAESDRKSK